MDKITKIVLSLAIVNIIGLGVLLFTPTKNISTGAVGTQPAVEYWVSSTATSGPITLTGTEVRIIATSTARHWLTFSAGNGCSQGFYVSLANDVAATANNGIFVASSTRFEIKPTEHPYTGSVRGLSNGGSCLINVVGE